MSPNAPDLSGYKEVVTRIADFKAKHPEGSLQSDFLSMEVVDGKTFVVVKGYAYRSPDDPRPGTGLAWEVCPGKTPYTRESELQNAETSAWGRAIVAALASESSSIASREEVRNRQAPTSAPGPVPQAERVDRTPDPGADTGEEAPVGLLKVLNIAVRKEAQALAPDWEALSEANRKQLIRQWLGNALGRTINTSRDVTRAEAVRICQELSDGT